VVAEEAPPPPEDLTGVFPWLRTIITSKTNKSDRNT